MRSLHRPGAGRAGERGAVLMVVLAAVVLLTVAVMGASTAIGLWEDIAVSEGDRLQTEALARSGVALLQRAFAEDDPGSDSFSDSWAAANDAPALPVEDLGWVSAKVEDEEGKLDVNWLVNNAGEADSRWVPCCIRLLTEAGLAEERAEDLTTALVDWIDPDDVPLQGGAEDDHYGALPHPYAAHNGKLRTVAELSLVRGFTPDLLWRGEAGGEGEAAIPPLSRFLTVYGGSARKVNVNTAPAEVLACLSESLDRELAEDIVAARQEGPFDRLDDLRDVPGMAEVLPSLSGRLSVTTSHLSVVVNGENGRASSRARAVLARSGKTVRLVYYRPF